MATIQISVSNDEKQKIDHLYKSMGMTISSATKIFYKQSLRDNGLPFRPQANRPGQIHAITPKITEDGTLILPDDVPEDVKDWVDNG